MPMHAGFMIRKAVVVPGTTTITGPATNTTFTVPLYNTLTIEAWGCGGAGCAETLGESYSAGSGALPGKSECLANDNATALARAPPGRVSGSSTGGIAGGADGVAIVGNTTTTNGANGTNGFRSGTVAIGGDGGASPNGGAGSFGEAGGVDAATAGTPGGGGGGTGLSSGATSGGGGGGGGAGAYAKSVYTAGVTSGRPAVGDVLHVNIGTPVTAPTGVRTAGRGGNGRVTITVA